MASDSLNIGCGTEQPEDQWEQDPNAYLIKHLNGSTTLLRSVDLHAKYVHVFAHIYEPVRGAQLPGQSHRPYSTHACVARYFVDGTPPEKGGAAGSMFHRLCTLQKAAQRHTAQEHHGSIAHGQSAHLPLQTDR